jgi:hypothetical protein
MRSRRYRYFQFHSDQIADIKAVAGLLTEALGVLVVTMDPGVLHVSDRGHPLTIEYCDQPWVLEDSAARYKALGDDAEAVLPEDVKRYVAACDRRITVSYVLGASTTDEALERVSTAILERLWEPGCYPWSIEPHTETWRGASLQARNRGRADIE